MSTDRSGGQRRRPIALRVSTLGLTLLLAVGGCRRVSDADPRPVRQIIEENNAKAERWYAAGQADSLATLFSEDVWQMPPNSPPLVGRDSLRRFWSTAMGWGHWTFHLVTQDVVTSGNVAVERGRYLVRFTGGPQAPMPSVVDSGNYVVLWRQDQDGTWRGVWDAPVSVIPPPGQAGQ
ncbi:MAG TPA: DUF4440 domain-containing protein [Gemmatimonadaceae bacterium]|nr:DUF4440 domain-containing protein [Gemmatimonadaceae bacterium]